MKATLVKETKVATRFLGLRRTARVLGCSEAHLSYVLHGRRKPGAELAAKLRKLGVEVPAAAAQ